MNNFQEYKAELAALVTLGREIEADILLQHKEGEDMAQETKTTPEESYQRWYTESSLVIKQLLPDRLAEFQELYMGDGRRRKTDIITFTIQDWMQGFRAKKDRFGKNHFDDLAIVIMRFRTQTHILKSVQERLFSKICDIKQFVQADVFDSELDAARELATHGFLRASGAVAGVVLERHLGQVSVNHNIKTRKKIPTIGDFNDLLKNNDVLDTPSWRQIQRLGDIRNLCAHNKQRDPTKEEVEELISGVDKYTKTLF